MSKEVRVTSSTSSRTPPRRRQPIRTPLSTSPKSRRSSSRARSGGPTKPRSAANGAAGLQSKNSDSSNLPSSSTRFQNMATAVVPDGLIVRARRAEDPDALAGSSSVPASIAPSGAEACLDADNDNKGNGGRYRPAPMWSLVLCVVVAIFTLFGVGRLCLPHEEGLTDGLHLPGGPDSPSSHLRDATTRPGTLESNDEPAVPSTWSELASRYAWHISELEHVVWYSWITAASTALGVLPFLFVRQFQPAVLAASNCVAAGMMIAATICLIWEGLMHKITEHGFDDSESAMNYWPVAGGFLGGCIFMLASKHYLDQHEHLKFIGFEGAGGRRILLILAVMTLHSLSEGIGIGVSFGSEHKNFGLFIAATLAIHNVPEGLATSLVLIPRGVSVPEAALWAVFTSLPQPLMAIPSYLFVQRFLPILPVGLGFASGAMVWVAMELLGEAHPNLDLKYSSTCTALSAAAMFAMQYSLR